MRPDSLSLCGVADAVRRCRLTAGGRAVEQQNHALLTPRADAFCDALDYVGIALFTGTDKLRRIPATTFVDVLKIEILQANPSQFGSPGEQCLLPRVDFFQ